MTAEGCRQWRESLGAYVLDQLPSHERAAVEAHLRDARPSGRGRGASASASLIGRAFPQMRLDRGALVGGKLVEHVGTERFPPLAASLSRHSPAPRARFAAPSARSRRGSSRSPRGLRAPPRPPGRGGRGSKSRSGPGDAARRSAAAPPRPATTAARPRAGRERLDPAAAVSGRAERARPRSMTTLRRIANSQVRIDPISGSNRSPARQARRKASCTASSARPGSPSERSAKPYISPPCAA